MSSVAANMNKVRNNSFVRAIDVFFHSPVFIMLIATMCVFSNVLSLELPFYLAVIVLSILTVIFSRDYLPLVPLVAYHYVSPSIGNNPGINPDSIYYFGNGFEAIISLIVIFFIFFLARIFLEGRVRKFFFSSKKLIWGMVVLGIAYMISGIGYEEYDSKNLLFAAVQFISLAAWYFIFATTIDWNNTPRDYIGWIGMMYGVIVAAELFNVYLTRPVVTNWDFNIINRGQIYTGWGHYNNIGAMLIMSLPFPFLLASRAKCGILYNLVGQLIMVAVFFSFSRGTLLVGAIVYLCCMVTTAVASKDKIGNGIICLLLISAIVVVLSVWGREIIEYLEETVYKQEIADDNGRIPIYKRGIEFFLKNPIFGTTFYSCDTFEWSSAEEMVFIPPRWHNTIVQLLASCGIVGLIAYLYHRVETLVMLFKKPTLEKVFVFFSVLALIGSSMLDCHFFNIGPVLFYSITLIFAEKSTKCDEKTALGILFDRGKI